MKPLLVGESNPWQKHEADAMRFAFYPEPRHASGGRLCHVILGLTARDYLRSFDRTDLCHPAWSLPKAKERARHILYERSAGDVILLCGVNVARAFGVSTIPFVVHGPSATYGCECPAASGPATLVTLPHPSGRNQAWQVPGAIDRARRILCELGVPCAAPETEAA